MVDGSFLSRFLIYGCIKSILLTIQIQVFFFIVGGDVCIRRLAAHRHLQRIVTAKLVAIVGILIAAENLAYALAHHLHVSMMDEFLLTRVGNEFP